MKVFDHHINIQSYYDDGIKKYINTFSNVILVSKGDIYISGGDLKMSGIIFAPNGKVVFNGRSFEGIVIAKDGFNVTSGGTDINFETVDSILKINIPK